MTQEETLTILKEDTEQNIYLGGQPGTGKSYLIKQYLEWATDNGIAITMAASTGIAAANIGGQTLHSYLGVRDDKPLSDDDLEQIVGNRYTFKRIHSTGVLVIDEISMVSAQLLENMDRIMRQIGDTEKPFGGTRIIAVGDFYQLPPVKGKFAFMSPVWEAAGFKQCILTHVYRQSEEVFLDVLHGVRKGELSEKQWDVLRSRFVQDVSGLDCIRIETHNDAVDAINDRKLQLIEGTPHVFTMTHYGNEKLVAGLIKNCLSPQILLLKIGAKVMFTQNDRITKQYINGTQGTITAIEGTAVTVQTFEGATITITTPSTWEFATGYGFRKEVHASISQYPLRLAYAITIHKSQGCTFDRAVIDPTRVFECGQAYVAISRVKTLDGLYLQGKFNTNFLEVHPEVISFYGREN